MKGKGIKVFGVIMSLLLVLSFAATFMVSSTSVVSAGTQKWTQISVPDTDDMQLAPGTDVGTIAVSPDGETLFAALYVWDDTLLPSPYTTGEWYVVKSVDGGYTWKNTEFADDTYDIVDIVISPAWEDDGIIVVATVYDAYISEKRGTDFQSMGFAAAVGDDISSFDIGLDSDGDATYILGSDVDAYLLSGFSGWEAQLLYDSSTGGYANTLIGVLDVAFSPNYGEDGVIFAMVTGTAPLETPGTHLRAASDTTVHNWGAYISDAHFIDEETTDNIEADSACMTFADDYNSQPAVFVGITAYDAGAPRGDAFRVDLVMGALGTSAVTDLNIRGTASSYKSTNVNSIDVSGSANSCFILAGLSQLSNTGPMSTWQGQVHYSANGGESWLQCYKPPSGLDMSQITAPVVVMAPDFADSGIAYVGNGYIPGIDLLFSGFYVSTTEGTTFVGRGLLDHVIDAITDVVPSPEYDSDSTLFMQTYHSFMTSIPSFPPYFGLLWETNDGGKYWDLILGMTVMIPLPGVAQTSVEIPSTYPVEPSIFVTGPTNFAGGDGATIVRSTDEGNLFATTIRGPYEGAIPQVIDAWKVIDKDTLIVASANRIWKTIDMGAHWIETEATDIASTESVVDLQLWNDTAVLVGTDDGNVYMCQNWETDFSFTQVDSGPGIAGDVVHVAFDTNYDDTGKIYAGVDSGGALTGGTWRIDANGGDEWEQIWSNVDVLSIGCDGNGILWAVANDNVWAASLREVNPTAPIDDLNPEWVMEGLTSELWLDLETAPTETYVFVIGGNQVLVNGEVCGDELWAYIDTLIKPTLISPANGATAAGTILQGNAMALVNLRWEEMPKADEYEFQVAYDTDFGSIAVSDSAVEGTQATIQLFLGEKYYWRVRAVDPILSQWSDVWTFTTPLGPASSKPVVTYPGSQDSHYDIPLKPTLTWTSTVECTGYELIVAKQCDWANPLINLTGSSALGTDTCYTITQSLQEGTNYCWKVRAINEDTGTASPWSDTGTFTTIVIEVEEEEGTPIWVWVVIALSAVLLVGVVVLIIRTRRPV